MLSVAAITFFGVGGSVAKPFAKAGEGEDLAHLSGAGKEREMDMWTFSGTQGTQKWDGKYLAFTKKETRYLAKDWKKIFVLPVPPANSSDRTRGELEYLKGLIPQREKYQKAIQGEVLTKRFKWGNIPTRN